MHRAFAGYLLLGLVAVQAAPAQNRPEPDAARKGSAAKPAKPARVLFVGNSYTFAREIPSMVAAIGEAATPPRAIEVRVLAYARWTLRQHWEQEGPDSAREVLKQERWDLVVLQEQSQLPYMKPEETLAYAARFSAEIAAAQAKPVFFMTWARKDEGFRLEQIAATYEQAATAGKGMLAPVGRAWESAAATAKDLELYESDGSHPNACGAWLAAAVLYTAMFGGDPKTIPASLDARERDVSRVLVTLKPHEAATLREAATSVLAPRQGAKVPKTRKDRQQTR